MPVQLLKNGCRLFNRHPFFLAKILFLFSVSHISIAGVTENLTPLPVIKPDFLARLQFATPELSIRLINDYQSEESVDSENWFLWEKKRLQLMAQLNQWQMIAQRIANYEATVLATHKVWLTLFRTSALLKISQPLSVRDDLRQLLWSDEEMTPEQIEKARRLIISSYLAEGKAQDAQRAMLRYQQDYGLTGEQWRLLQARVLMATGRYQQAERLLANEQSAKLQAFKTLTQLRSGDVSASHVLTTALNSLKAEPVNNKQTDDDQYRRQNWMLAYIAAGILKKPETEITSLEKILVTGIADAEYDLINVTADTLWQSYIQYASAVGNQRHLLIGDDNAWFETAINNIEKKPVQSRALFAMLGIKAGTEHQRTVSLEQLATRLKKMEKASLLIQQVFFESTNFKSMQKIPVMVRYQMLDNALSRGKIKQAAQLFKFLPEPPEGKKKLAWDMRRARVLVYGGQYRQAQQALEKILQRETLNTEWQNRLMQVLFDLQKVDQHAVAIELFKLVETKTNDVNLHRELKFWMAESYQSLKKYERAAHLYLISANIIAEKHADPWAQTARYRSAENMMQAGLINDARDLYQQLLKVTDNKGRQNSIKQKLQQLWLMEGKQEHAN